MKQRDIFVEVLPSNTSELLRALQLPWSRFVGVLFVKDFHGGGVHVVLGRFPCSVIVPCPFDVVMAAAANHLEVEHFLDFVLLIVVDDDCGWRLRALSFNWVVWRGIQ